MKKKIIKILLLLLWGIFVYYFVGYTWGPRVDIVYGNSMFPTFHSGDMIFSISKFDTIKNNDVICFNKSGQKLLKRVIGIPGDKIILKYGILVVNGKLQEDAYLLFPNTFANNKSGYLEIIMGKDEYFVLGDSRDTSYDSRYFGVIKKSQIISKCILKTSLPFIEGPR